MSQDIASVPATPEHEAFFQDALAALKGAAARHPSIRTIEVLAVIGKMAGFAVSVLAPAEQETAIRVFLVNMHTGSNELDKLSGPAAGSA